ncbi:leucine-rich repeat-containing protein 58-like, partial [Trichomycterus rosablanca]
MECSEGADGGERVLDLSHLGLNSVNVDSVAEKRRAETSYLLLCYNRLTALPISIHLFTNLQFLDVSNNALTDLSEAITGLSNLQTLLAKNNRLDEFSLPKDLSSLQRLEVVNLSGNRFEQIPKQLLHLPRLQSLSFGGNRLKHIPAEIDCLK